MAFDLASLLYDPWMNFGINMMASNVPSRDPRSGTLGWGLLQGLQGAQGAQQSKEDMESRRAYAARQQAEMLRKQQDDAKARQQEQAYSQTLAGMLNPPQQVIGQMDVPGLPPGGDPMNVYAPPNADQQRAQAMQRIQQLSQVDPDTAMKMLTAVNSGAFPGMPKPPTQGATPWGLDLIPEDERARVARIKLGLEPNAYSEESLRLREAGLGLQEQRLGLARERAAGGGGGGGPTGANGSKPLTKAEWTQRLAIERARASIAKLGVKRNDAEAMAKNDAGFKSALDLANKKMPGDDPAWESTMRARAATAKTGGKSVEDYQAKLDMTTDPSMRKLLIEAARRKGVILVDKKKVQTGGWRGRLGF